MGATQLPASEFLPWCDCRLYFKLFKIMLLWNGQTSILRCGQGGVKVVRRQTAIRWKAVRKWV